MIKKHLTQIILTLIIISSFLTFLSAEVNVTYKVKYGIIESDNSFTDTGEIISNYETEGYVCTSLNCATIGNKINSLSKKTLIDKITLTYPTILANSNGYAIYFFKEDYIGWEQKSITLAGNGNMNSTKNIYLSRKRTGYAPIINFTITKKEDGKMIEVNSTIGIDSETMSAIKKTSTTGIPINEKVNTTIELRIVDADKNLIKTEKTNVLIPYSREYKINFNHTFSKSGNYTIELISKITDKKIINPVEQKVEKIITILEYNSTNYSFASLDSIGISPAYIQFNKTANISLNWKSNYINSTDIIPINMSLYIIIKSGENITEKKYFFLPASSNPLTSNNFIFPFIINKTGVYSMELIGIPNSTFPGTKYPNINLIHLGNITPTQNDTPTINKKANLTITSNPSNAQIFLNGLLRGNSPLTLYNIDINNYSLKVVKTGYLNYTSWIIIKEGNNIINAILTPLNITENNQTASLNIISNPLNASVFIDGEFKGNTPNTFYNLTIGNHNLEIIKEGYNTYQEIRQLNNGTNFMSVNLTATNITNGTIPQITIYSPIASKKYNKTTILVNASSNEIVNWTYKLDSGSLISILASNNVSFNINAKEGINNLTLCASNLFKTICQSVIFNVDSSNSDDDDDDDDDDKDSKKKYDYYSFTDTDTESFNQTIIVSTKPASSSKDKGINSLLFIYLLLGIVIILLLIVLLIYINRL